MGFVCVMLSVLYYYISIVPFFLLFILILERLIFFQLVESFSWFLKCTCFMIYKMHEFGDVIS